jgi:Fe-S cluster biosynthesis and repair protein YggX
MTKTLGAVVVVTTEFPNGLKFSVFPQGGGARVYTTRSESALRTWLRRRGYAA